MPGILTLLWQKLVRPQEIRPAAAIGARRVWVQECTRMVTLDEAPSAPNPERFEAAVEEISRYEACLCTSRQILKTSLLSIELPQGEKADGDSILAYVVKSLPQGNNWLLTCVFSTELSEEDLRSFGGSRTRPPPPTRRAWSRFPLDRAVAYRSLRTADEQKQLARAVDISVTGIGLVVHEPIEAGAVLSLDIMAGPGQPEKVMQVCVVRAGSETQGQWRLGCNFIRQLQEDELQAFLSQNANP
jgi:hypothetical protein